MPHFIDNIYQIKMKHVRTCTHTHVIVSSKRKPYNVSTPLDPQEYRTVLNIFNPSFKSSFF
jgi:hypothetical protein